MAAKVPEPPKYGTIIWSLIRTAFLSWLVFNIIGGSSALILVNQLPPETVAAISLGVAQYLVGGKAIFFEKILPEEAEVYSQRLDTDHDGTDEWVVFYRYDIGTSRSPVGGAVYDVSDCRPPAILSYELRPFDYDYLAEGSAQAEMADVDEDGKEELIIRGKTGDLVTDLAIFRWFDYHTGCEQPPPGARGYELVGSFRGPGGVSLSGAQVVVKDRDGFERSQFAIKKVYKLQNGAYLLPDRSALLPPVETGIDFTFGQPTTVTESYYPEKAVLAFYLTLGKHNENEAQDIKALTTENAYSLYRYKDPTLGIPLDNRDLDHVLVKEIAYYPDVAQERVHADRTVTVTVVGLDVNSTPLDGPHTVNWVVKGVEKQSALPYGCEWRLDYVMDSH